MDKNNDGKLTLEEFLEVSIISNIYNDPTIRVN